MFNNNKNKIGNIGDILTTAAIAAEIKRNQAFNEEIEKAIEQYLIGSWGTLTAEDKEENEKAVKEKAGRIIARYKTSVKDIYIITEYERNKTMIMFCNEY